MSEHEHQWILTKNVLALCTECDRALDTEGILAILNENAALERYADKLADGFPDGMLPKDVEVLRKANHGLAEENASLTGKAERLRELIDGLCSLLNTNAEVIRALISEERET